LCGNLAYFISSVLEIPVFCLSEMLHSVALQGGGNRGTSDLAFHARLMELALQAANAAAPRRRDGRKRVKSGNAQGPEGNVKGAWHLYACSNCPSPLSAVDVNWPVPSACVPAATTAARLRTFTGGLTSTARLDRCSGRPLVSIGVDVTLFAASL
jgi:hypothetical protein